MYQSTRPLIAARGNNEPAPTMVTACGSENLCRSAQLSDLLRSQFDGTSGYTISNLFFNGNLRSRQNFDTCLSRPQDGQNLTLRGGNFLVDNVWSVGASISNGSVTGNNVYGNQGTRGFMGCTLSEVYTADHFGAANIQPGYVVRNYDNMTCNP